MLYTVIIACTAVLVAIDQVIKMIVDANMEIGESVVAIKGLLNWHYLRNDGASFSMLEGKRWFFVVGTLIIIAVIAVVIAKKKIYHWLGYAATTLVIAGGIGNLIDRIRLGEVIDYIDISPLFSFAVFNFADCCIVVGGIMLCVYILFMHDRLAPKSEKNVSKADE